MKLQKKVAVVTGAGQGIGRGIAAAFAREGAVVIVADKDEAHGRAAAEMIADAGGTARFLPTDIAQPDQVAAMVTQTVAQFGRLDVLVNNAGVGGRKLGDGPLHECTLEGWDAIMNVNLRGTFLACKYALPHLLESKGCIVSVASVLGLFGSQDLYDTHAYMTSKAGVIGLTRTIAAYYAGAGVRANCLAPGLIDTQMAKRTKADDQLLAKIGFWQPLGPIGAVRDVAEAAVFLASDDAAFITGVVLPVDGGWSVQ